MIDVLQRTFIRPFVIIFLMIYLSPLGFVRGDAVFAPQENQTASSIRHPVIAGFERFAKASETDQTEWGRLLLAELGCLSCHSPTEPHSLTVSTKRAPILDTVGSRIQPAYLRRFIAEPHLAKPGTTMPNLLARYPAAERQDIVEALTHFLASTGKPVQTFPSSKAIAHGKTLFAEVGCLACHDAQEATAQRLENSVPLVPFSEKYTLSSLSAFLSDPGQVRPSGRMPSLNLEPQDAKDLASYLLRDLQALAKPKLLYKYYEGSWDDVPNFTDLRPLIVGQSPEFDLSVVRRSGDYALRFESTLRVEKDGEYTFYLNSDDGSRLTIDDQLVVDNGGIHPPQEKSGKIRLTKGDHRLVVGLFNAGGEAALDLEFEAPERSRQSILPSLRLDDGDAAHSTEDSPGFAVDGSLITKGKELFTKIGCISCHQQQAVGSSPTPSATAPALSRLQPNRGCLDPKNASPVAYYPLNDRQRSALNAAIASPTPQSANSAKNVTLTLHQFHCYACHQRDGIGGVEESRNPFFETTQKEMGDEGRIPPHLTGVGGKLQTEYLEQIFGQGAKDRPYMKTRMPNFGAGNLKGLAKDLGTVDTLAAVATPEFAESPRKIKAIGRFLAGGEALGCIKCHTFKGIQAEGVQAIDMTIMTKRLRHDWFHRYLLDPPAFRPGTRMPTAWPMGQSLLPAIFDGNSSRQIESIWRFLSDGATAAEPYGLGRDPIPLAPGAEPIIYRNFIEGAGPRAIGVGYPERVNLAFDANELRLALLWQGAFIDASRHWTGRGEGFQAPLGDNVISPAPGIAFARVASLTTEWPNSGGPRRQENRFRGYHLSKEGRPTFRYDVGGVHVEDSPSPAIENEAPRLRRTISLTAASPPTDLWFRAVVADHVELAPDGWATINHDWKLKLTSSNISPTIRVSAGKSELLILVPFSENQATIVEEFVW